MHPKRITVFGGTGFLGRATVHELLDAGHTVRIASRRLVLPDSLQNHPRVEHCRADIRDDADVARAVEDARGVINAVSLYVEQRNLRFTTIHVEGAARLARAARNAGLERVVQISGIGADSRSPSSYIRARAQGEAAVLHEFPNAVIVRPSVLFGPGDAFLRNLAGLAPLPVIPLFGRGTTRLQPVHVSDIARALARLCADEPPTHPIYELGGPDILTYRQIVALVLTHLSRKRPMLPIPFTVWHALAALGSLLPNPPLTRDQLYLMQQDNIANPTLGTFADLGITPHSLEQSLPDCLPTH
ncbi:MULTISPECIES: complex I NDUFA9 subunit family protein [unclassified Thioalkalivibrio]|uniref:complex I NDUFA9 subunit family protein n=1 Tax=unclassified Thioalkalivibrio TaxID=2621013 RepID=UPI000368B554|nr:MULTISPECIES: complex I NDUFA9 subunit family protein [unclassified Thioalkalivibrio]